jgi:hypothetical protein
MADDKKENLMKTFPSTRKRDIVTYGPPPAFCCTATVRLATFSAAPISFHSPRSGRTNPPCHGFFWFFGEGELLLPIDDVTAMFHFDALSFPI